MTQKADILYQNSTQNPKRIAWIDAFRGGAIILIVMGHTITFGVVDYKDSESLCILRLIITTVWLPAFFWISGFLSFKPHGAPLIKSVSSKFSQLIIPTVVISCLWAFSHHHGYSVLLEGFGRFWFTAALFEMWLVYAIIRAVFARRAQAAVWLGIILSFLAVLESFAPVDLETSPYQSFNLLNVCLYSQFFFVGIGCRMYEDKFMKIFRHRPTVGILAILYILILTLQVSYLTKGTLICGFVNVELSRWVLLLLAIGIFVQAESFFDKDGKAIRFIKFIGKRTLDIYFLHYFLIPDISWLKCIFGHNEFVLQIIALSIVAAIIITFCLLISNLLRRSEIVTRLLFGK